MQSYSFRNGSEACPVEASEAIDRARDLSVFLVHK